jgi:hypothetical protein
MISIAPLWRRPASAFLSHNKPLTRGTWSPHALDGWYVGPALESYRCYTIWMWDTRAERTSDTVSWSPTKIPMPLASSTDLILAGIANIHHALTHPSPGSALAPTTDSQVAALTHLTGLLTSLCKPTDVPPPGLSKQPLRVPNPTLPPPVVHHT